MKKVIFQTMPEQVYILMHEDARFSNTTQSCAFYGLPSEITLQNALISRGVNAESINKGMEIYRQVLVGEKSLDCFYVDGTYEEFFFLKSFDLIKNPDTGSGE